MISFCSGFHYRTAFHCSFIMINFTATVLVRALHRESRQLWRETCLESCEANEALLQQKHYQRSCLFNSIISPHYMCCADLRSLTQPCISCEWLTRASASFSVTATKRKFIRTFILRLLSRAKITLSFHEWLLFSLLWSEALQSGCSFCWLHGCSSRWRQTTRHLHFIMLGPNMFHYISSKTTSTESSAIDVSAMYSVLKQTVLLDEGLGQCTQNHVF